MRFILCLILLTGCAHEPPCERLAPWRQALLDDLDDAVFVSKNEFIDKVKATAVEMQWQEIICADHD